MYVKSLMKLQSSLQVKVDSNEERNRNCVYTTPKCHIL